MSFCYQNTISYLELKRLLKLYNDLEIIKRKALDVRLASELDGQDKIMLNIREFLNIAYDHH